MDDSDRLLALKLHRELNSRRSSRARRQTIRWVPEGGESSSSEIDETTKSKQNFKFKIFIKNLLANSNKKIYLQIVTNLSDSSPKLAPFGLDLIYIY